MAWWQIILITLYSGVQIFDELNAKGVHLFAQLNPSVEAHDFMKLLNDKINR